MGADRWCYPIPMALQRHTGSHNDVPALKPVPDVQLAPETEKKSEQDDAAPACQTEAGPRD
jgi:hypothetical protein